MQPTHIYINLYKCNCIMSNNNAHQHIYIYTFIVYTWCNIIGHEYIYMYECRRAYIYIYQLTARAAHGAKVGMASYIAACDLL